jgi:hypothetical protein
LRSELPLELALTGHGPAAIVAYMGIRGKIGVAIVALAAVTGCSDGGGDDSSDTAGATTNTAGATSSASTTDAAGSTELSTSEVEPTSMGTPATSSTDATTGGMDATTEGPPPGDHAVVGLELCALSEPLPSAQNWASNDIAIAADPAGTVLYVGIDESEIHRYTIEPGDDCVLTREADFGALAASHTALAVDAQKAVYTALENGYNVGRAWPTPEVDCMPEPYGRVIAVRPDGGGGVSAGFSDEPFGVDLLSFGGDTCTSSKAQWDLSGLGDVEDVAIDAQGRVHVLADLEGEPSYISTVAVYDGGARVLGYLNTGLDKDFANASAVVRCGVGQTCVFSYSAGLVRFDASGVEVDLVEFDTFAGDVVLLDATGGGDAYVYIAGITNTGLDDEQRLIYRRTL